MATVKKTLSLDADAWAFAERAARAAGLSPSAWLSRAARQQAIRQGYRTGPLPALAEDAAVADEAEAALAGEEWRAAG
jgi:hypothetical protein